MAAQHVYVAGEVLTAANLNLMAWGAVAAPVQVTADQGSITTVVDLTSLTMTFTAVANRRYRITGTVFFQSTVANDQVQLVIADGSSTQIQAAALIASVSATSQGLVAIAFVQPSAGSTTYKLRMLRGSGSGTITMKASATVPGTIAIEDIGST